MVETMMMTSGLGGDADGNSFHDVGDGSTKSIRGGGKGGGHGEW